MSEKDFTAAFAFDSHDRRRRKIGVGFGKNLLKKRNLRFRNRRRNLRRCLKNFQNFQNTTKFTEIFYFDCFCNFRRRDRVRVRHFSINEGADTAAGAVSPPAHNQFRVQSVLVFCLYLKEKLWKYLKFQKNILKMKIILKKPRNITQRQISKRMLSMLRLLAAQVFLIRTDVRLFNVQNQIGQRTKMQIAVAEFANIWNEKWHILK